MKEITMKIAIPTIGGIIDEHLEICEVFTIYSVDDSQKIVDSELLYTPEGCDCKNNIPLTMQQKGVTVILAYKFPENAEDICKQHGIKTYQGYSGNISKAIESFLQNTK